MNYVFDVLITLILFTLYGVIHSILASIKVKEFFKKHFGNLIAFYRLLYNIVSIALLYFIYKISPKPHLIIYDLPNPYDLFTMIPQFLALAGLVWTFNYICFKEFLGISQIQRFMENSYDTDLDEKLTLRIEGPYRFSRHPIYFFSITFLLFRPTMDLFYLTIFFCIVIYFYSGSVFEEKKLIQFFGEKYLNYKQSVPRIFPINIFKPYPKEKPLNIVQNEKEF